MARPKKDQVRLFAERKRLIINSIKNAFTQSEVADIFRIPRNTVWSIMKESKKLSTDIKK